MPSKKQILKKIEEIERELNKLKAMVFEHYFNSQETKPSSILGLNVGESRKNAKYAEDKTPDTYIDFTKGDLTKCIRKPIPAKVNIPKIKVPDEIKIRVKRDLDRFLRNKKEI